MRTVIVMLVALLGGFMGLDAQVVRTEIVGVIDPYPVGIACAKTVNLIFPYSVRSVDRGSADVMVMKAPGAENVLHVKAGVEWFSPTNLTVLTGEGRVYSFLLSYASDPPMLNIRVAGATGVMSNVILQPGEMNEGEVADVVRYVSGRQRTMSGPRQRVHAMGMALTGMFIKDDNLYFQIEMKNDSYMPYDVGQFRLYVRDRKVAKRTAVQELEVEPRSIYGNVDHIAGKSRNKVVLVLERFTIPDKKDFVLQLMERNGGRHLSIKIRNKHLVRAKPI